MKTTLMLLCVAATLAVFVPRAQASEWNKKTYMTFNEPVEVPGTVLPPGTYVFKLLDTIADRNVVQIFNKDETHLYATVLAIPDYRLQPAGRTIVSFEERPAGAPEAIRAWFFPGDNYGQEFVYPQRRAFELAKANRQPVPSMPAGMEKNTREQARSASAPSVMAMKKARIKAAEPSGGETEVAQAIQTHPAAAPGARPAKTRPVRTAMARQPRRLPKTASTMPLVGLLGLVSAGAALGLRRASQTRG